MVHIMTLVNFSLIAVSIASILISLTLIMLLATSVVLYRRLNKVLDQLEVMTQTGLETSRTVREYVDRTGNAITEFTRHFITLRGAAELIGYIGDSLRESRAKQREETHGNKSE